jgi:chromatin modification-related protein EAF6
MSNGNAVAKRRKELRKELALIEKQIFDLETTYLEETRDIGNIFAGWKAYLANEKQKPIGKKDIPIEARLFSLSSVTSPASRAAGKDGAEGAAADSGGRKRKNDA